MKQQEAAASREDRILDDIAKIEKGGPEKYRQGLAKEGKLFVRDRLRLYFGASPKFEDGLFANNLKEDLPADGMVTGVGDLDGRSVFFMANDYTVKAGSMAE